MRFIRLIKLRWQRSKGTSFLGGCFTTSTPCQVHAKCKRILKINPGMSLWSGTGERTNRWSGWKPDWLNDATLRHFWGLGVATFNPTTLVCKAPAINWYLAKDSLFWWTSTYAGLLRLSNFKLGPKWNLEFQTLPVLRFDKSTASIS